MAITFAQVVVDSGNAGTLAGFYAIVLNRSVDSGANQYFATIGRSGPEPMPTAIMFVQVPEGRASKNRLHIDLASTDYGADVDRAIAAGAQKVAEHDEYGTVWTTLRDPEGNVFDIARKSQRDGSG